MVEYSTIGSLNHRIIESLNHHGIVFSPSIAKICSKNKRGLTYMEESLFIRELGIKSPMLRVLDFLMDNESFDYSKTDIAEGTELSRTTLFKAWSKLEALDLIIATRTVGQAKMYKLNKKSPIVKKLMELDDSISEYFAMKHFNPGAHSSDDISEIINTSQDLVKDAVDHEGDSSNNKRDRYEKAPLA